MLLNKSVKLILVHWKRQQKRWKTTIKTIVKQEKKIAVITLTICTYLYLMKAS